MARTKKTKHEINIGGNVTGSVVVAGDNNIIHYYAAVEANIEKHEPDYWALTHPYPMPPNFTGRVAERAMLVHWLNDDAENRLFVLRAFGGFGKSALSWHWLTHDIDPVQWPKVLWWSFYEGDASFENFVISTLDYLKVDIPQGQRPQVDELLKAMQRQKILLIMDGFERVLRAYSSMNAAYQGDEEPKLEDNQLDCVNINAEIFLRSVCSLPNIKSKVLMTTRLTPHAVKPRGEFILGCREAELTAMQKEDAVEFFRRLKIKGTRAEIEAACASYGYHPLSLRLLAGRILKDFRSPADIVVAQKLKIDGGIIQQKHHVLEVSYNNLPKREQKLLSTIACFRASVELKTLEAIAENKDTLDSDLHDLVDRGLLFHNSHLVSNHPVSTFDLHPIVRRHAYERLTGPERETTHTCLRNYFAALDIPEQPETLDDLASVVELYHHSVQAQKLDDAFVLHANRLSKPLYFKFGFYQLEVDLLSSLLDNKTNSPRLSNERYSGRLLNDLGNSYALNGQPRRAAQLFEHAVKIGEQQGETRNLIIRLQNLSHMAQLHLGLLRAAEANLQRGSKISKELTDDYHEAICHQELGHLLTYRGMWREAKQRLDMSYKYNKENTDLQGMCLDFAYYGLWGIFKSRDHRISEPHNQNQAINFARKAVDLVNIIEKQYYLHPRDLVRAYWILGAACRRNRKPKLAERHLGASITNCRAINLVDHEADILLELARLRYDQKKYEEARTLAEEALHITERCSYVLQGADVNLFLAQYALEQEKDRAKAKEYAETALKLAYCDGPPYYYKVAYEEAERFLERLK